MKGKIILIVIVLGLVALAVMWYKKQQQPTDQIDDNKSPNAQKRAAARGTSLKGASDGGLVSRLKNRVGKASSVNLKPSKMAEIQKRVAASVKSTGKQLSGASRGRPLVRNNPIGNGRVAQSLVTLPQRGMGVGVPQYLQRRR